MNTPVPVLLHGYSGDGRALNEFASICFPGAEPLCVDLPGFGTSPLDNIQAETDPKAYVEETWKVVRRAVPEGKIHLVGHSYGACLAFILAAQHPDAVTRVDLLTPGVMTKLPTLTSLYAITVLRFIPGALTFFTWVSRQPIFVDAVTNTMEYKDWPEARKQQIRAMRRGESDLYSPQMFKLSLHALRMPRAFKAVHCSVPVRIIHANDDTVTRYASSEWLMERSEHAAISRTYGGHLGLLAEPERWAALLHGTSES